MGLNEGGGVAVEVDRTALLAEADAIAGNAPVNDVSAPVREPTAQDIQAVQIDPAQKAAAVSPMLARVIDRVANWAAPNWQITEKESAALGDDVALVMAHWMPDNAIEPKYMALLSLGMSLYSIADARRDKETGAFKPLRAKPVEVQQQQTQAPAGTGALSL